MKSINERIDALLERTGLDAEFAEKDIDVEELMPVDFGTKRNVKVGGNGYLGQRFPVTLYGPSWLWLLQEENIEKILTFLEENVDSISWEK